MTSLQIRVGLTVVQVLVLAVAIVATVHWYAWLDQRSLAGVVIVGLAFCAIAIFGIHLQLGEDLGEDASPNQMLRRFLIYAGQMLVFIPSFAGGIWLVHRAVAWLLPPTASRGAFGMVFILAFLGYIAGVIRLLTWLSNRGIIGGRF